MRRTLLALLVAAQFVAAPAMAPTAWQVGDSWAVGNEVDFSWIFDELTSELRTSLDDSVGDSNFPVKSYDINNEGSLGLYHKGEVVDDLDFRYHIKSETGFYTHVATDWQATVELPVAGYYEDVEERCDDEGCKTFLADGTEMPVAVQQVSFTAGFDQVERVAVESWWTQDEIDLTKIDITLSQGTEFDFSILNAPNFTDELSGYDGESDTEYYDWKEVRYDSVSWGGSIEVSFHLLLEFDEPMNVLDLPIEEGEIWGGSTLVTISGDLGGRIDLDKPVSSACPEDDCDQMLELQELYKNLTENFAEMDVDRSFQSWGDLFPLHIPSNWMQELLDAALDQMEEEERDAYDDSGANLRIEGNRFHFGPVEIPEPIHYNFTTGGRLNVPLADGSTVEAFEVLPYESEEEREDDSGNEDPMDPNDPGRDEGEEEEENEGEGEDEMDRGPPVEAHSYIASDTGRIVYMHMDMPVPGDESGEQTISLEAEEVAFAEADTAIDQKADPSNPQRNGPDPEEVDEPGFPLPGVGLLAVLPLALAARRRFR